MRLWSNILLSLMSQYSRRSSITLDTHAPIQPTVSVLPSDSIMAPVVEVVRPDIEHMPVANDPRAWTSLRKNLSLTMIASAAMIAGLAGSIQNREEDGSAVQQMQFELPATSSQFSWSISAFILVQGLMPLIWSAISEVKGRKLVYVISLALFTVGSIVVAISRNIGLVIGFRCLQAAGSSAVITIGAATLADMFEPAERGTKMGIYYIAPLLGPSIGPILGGGLTTGLGWRAIFWFLTIVGGSICVLFVVAFRDTFRKERSLTYQNVLRQRLYEAHDEMRVHKSDVEKIAIPEVVVTLSLKDVNPFKPIFLVLRRMNNVVILFASGLLFAFGFLIAYASARTLSNHYHYNALTIGLVIVSFGIGSLLGGHFSDHELARLKAANGNVSYPEMRLKNTVYSSALLPPCVLAFGWLCEQRVHVAVICVMLFFCGFFSIWTYASTLAYIADSNIGRSSSAFATNSAFRGVSAFVAIEIAVPLQDGLGDGWTYTLWAGLMLISGLLILLVAYRGEGWRRKAEKREGLYTSKL
ncbi:hypothetical protein DXG01_001419 [Tephrocybe rancida]|nr:hypothetical protein DXG01_001419 [Tephrocybe rancida]